MHQLVLYYRRQAGGRSETGIGPIYSTPPYLQRWHGIGDFLAVYFAGFTPYFGAELKLLEERLYVLAATFYLTLQKINQPLRSKLKILFPDV